MTLQDFKLPTLKAYYQNSLYIAKVDCPRRQKHAHSPGLNIKSYEPIGVVTRQFDRWKWVIKQLMVLQETN